jgi:hypothetical protein
MFKQTMMAFLFIAAVALGNEGGNGVTRGTEGGGGISAPSQLQGTDVGHGVQGTETGNGVEGTGVGNGNGIQ